MAIEWVPGAGGYVDSSTGKVVSTTPQTNSSGKTQVKVSSPTSSSSSSSKTTTSSSKPLLNAVKGAITGTADILNSMKANGSTTMENAPELKSIVQNTKGSTEDANKFITAVGSLGSLNNNTKKTSTGTLGTNATQSPVAGNTNLNTPMDWIAQYDKDVAENNLQGQINDLTQLQRMGQTMVNAHSTQALLSEALARQGTTQEQTQMSDRDAEIAAIDAMFARMDAEKAAEREAQLRDQIEIENNRTAAKYERKIAKYNAMGDYVSAQAVQDEYDAWQQQTGYRPDTGTTATLENDTTALDNNPMGNQQNTQQVYDTQLDLLNQNYLNRASALQTEYVSAYTNAINDVTNGIIAQIGNLINFQYDPNKDMSLHIAQGYATGKVKEAMNSTGMYYSSMTQSAITKAVAELVPVYEKMAREEIQSNLQMLQNLGNYLMNLEEMQFNMWKTQVDIKFKEAELKRQEVADAWTRVDNLGYVDNTASTILGIPAGTLSYKARAAMEEAQRKLDEELRKYAHEEYMAELTEALQEQKAEKQNELDMDRDEAKAYLDNWKSSQDDYRSYLTNAALKEQQHGYDIELENVKARNDLVKESVKAKNSKSADESGEVTYTNAQATINKMIEAGDDMYDVLEYINSDALVSSLDTAQRQNLLQYANSSIRASIAGLENLPADLLGFTGAAGLGVTNKSLKFIDNYFGSDKTAEDFGKMIDNVKSRGGKLELEGEDGNKYTVSDTNTTLEYFLANVLGYTLENNEKLYADDYATAMGASIDTVKEFSDYIDASKGLTKQEKDAAKENAWTALIDSAYNYEKTLKSNTAGISTPMAMFSAFGDAPIPVSNDKTYAKNGTDKILLTIGETEGKNSDVYAVVSGYLGDLKTPAQTTTTTTTTPSKSTKTNTTRSTTPVYETDVTKDVKAAAGAKLKQSMSGNK